MQCVQSKNFVLSKAREIGPSGTFSHGYHNRDIYEVATNFLLHKWEIKISNKLNLLFFSCEKAPVLLSSRSRYKAVWMQLEISNYFLYHLKFTQCFLIFNLISWYFQTCLTSPCFSALLVELHRSFRENRAGILKYSACTWDIRGVVKGIFVIREWPNLFLVKCEIVCFFLVNRGSIRSHEPWFSKITLREMRKKY